MAMDIAEVTQGDNPYTESREDYIKRMTAAGFDVFAPGPREVFLDLDSSLEYGQFIDQIFRVLLDYPEITWVEYPSKTRGHAHIVVTMPWDLDKFERVAWQAVLGSDPTREFLALHRIHRGDDQPVLLARPRSKYGIPGISKNRAAVSGRDSH